MAAEIAASRTERARRALSRFNEAAANGRGNHGYPRGAATTSASCFNEAAANGRGNRRPARIFWPPCAGFNEAAANGRGNRGNSRSFTMNALPASMRPRRMAAEIGRPVRDLHLVVPRLQ